MIFHGKQSNKNTIVNIQINRALPSTMEKHNMHMDCVASSLEVKATEPGSTLHVVLASMLF